MMRELAERYEHEDDAMTRAEIAMEMASAYLKEQAERWRSIDAEWLRGLKGAEVLAPDDEQFYGIDIAGIRVQWFDNEADCIEGWAAFCEGVGALCMLSTRGQLLDLLAGLRGDESARGTP